MSTDPPATAFQMEGQPSCERVRGSGSSYSPTQRECDGQKIPSGRKTSPRTPIRNPKAPENFNLDEILAKMQGHSEKLLAEHAKCTQASLTAAMQASLGQMDANYQARFDASDARMCEVEKRLAAIETSQSSGAKRVEKLATEVAAASATEPPPRVLDHLFDRAPHQNVIIARASDITDSGSVREVLDALLAEAGLESNVADIKGDGPRKRFEIVFNGNEALGAKRANKVLAVQQKDASGWREHWGRGSGDRQVQLFFDADKSRKQEKGEIIGKKVRNYLRDRGFKAFLSKEEAMVSVNFLPVADVLIESEREFEIKWNLQWARDPKNKFDKNKANEEIKAMVVSPAAAVSWG